MNPQDAPSPPDHPSPFLPTDLADPPSRELLAAIAVQVPTCIAVVAGRELRHVFVNQAYQALAPGLPLLGRSLPDVFAREVAAEVRARVLEVLDSGRPWQLDAWPGPLPGRPDARWRGRVTRLPQDPEEPPRALLAIDDAGAQSRAEEALRESEQRYRSLFANMTEGFALGEAICGEDGAPHDFRFLEMNDAFERQSGLARTQLQGRPMREVLPQLERHWIDTYCRVAMTGEAVRFENYNRDLDRHFSVYSYSPAPGRFAIVFSDITARKRAEEASARDHEMLTRLFERLPVMITAYDPRLRTFRFNDEFRRVLGWTEQDAAGGDLMTLAYPDPVVRAQAAAHMSGQAPGWREFLVTARDGRTVPSTWANLRLSDDTHVGIGIDLTERRQAEGALRAAHDTFRHLVQNSPFGVYVVDADFRLAEVSAGARKVFENVQPLLGRDFAEVLRAIWPEPFASEAIGLFRRTLETGEPYHAPATIERRQDIEAIESYDWKIERITLPDGRHGVVCHFYDLSERQRYEAALREADRRKDEFLATLAHELRNPLAPIRNAAAILQRAGHDEAVAARACQTIERQLQQMVRLVDDLLDVSRITRGRIQLRRERVVLAAVLESAIETARPLLERAGHRFSLTLPGEALWLDADVTRLAQVVANVLNNAAKYTPAGGHVWLTAAREGSEALIEVGDTGIGIPPALLPNVFDMFMQVETSIERSQGGLGIGLTLVKGLVELHGGRVEAHSAGPGQGSAVRIRLPLAAMPAAAAGIDASRPVPAARRILVVDDNRDAADTLGLLLQMLGSEVRVAHDGERGLAAAREFRPHLALLDIGMPGMNGYELARRLRGEQPGLLLVAVTGWGQEHDRRRSREAGFDHHLTKPVGPEELEALLAAPPG